MGGLEGTIHLPKVMIPQASGGKGVPYISISDRLQAGSDHYPCILMTQNQGIDHVGVLSSLHLVHLCVDWVCCAVVSTSCCAVSSFCCCVCSSTIKNTVWNICTTYKTGSDRDSLFQNIFSTVQFVWSTVLTAGKKCMTVKSFSFFMLFDGVLLRPSICKLFTQRFRCYLFVFLYSVR